MIKRCLLTALLLLSGSGALAQVRVELSFEQESYLAHEPLYAVVRVYNSSGQTLQLGKTPDWLSFSVEALDGSVVKQKKPADVVGEFSLPSASRAKKTVNLADAFELTKVGRYKVTATVHIPQWDADFTTPFARQFMISTGVKLWETAFGIPAPAAGARPEIRKFQLLQANHLKELNLYVRVTDDTEADTFSLFPLGALIGFSRPEPQLDRWSNLHVLYQDGAKRFRYNVITPDGMLLTRQTWEIEADVRPAMVVNADGRIQVKGGVRRVSASDLPPPELLSEKSSAPADPLNSDQPVNAEKSSK